MLNKNTHSILIILILIIILIILCLNWCGVKCPSSSKNIKSGYFYNRELAYIKSNFYKKNPIIIWIPGGGLSSSLFAFCGIGPYIIKNKKLKDNSNFNKNYPQLFIDICGRGFSVLNKNSVPNEDYIIKMYIKSINKLCKDRKLILIGMSYGGKLSIKIQRQLKNVIKVICVTPFIDPYHSSGFIPDSLETLFKPTKEYLQKKVLLKKEFKDAINHGNIKNILSYMDQNGKISSLVKQQLKLDPINMWNIDYINKPTFSNTWITGEILNNIWEYLQSNNILKNKYLKPLYYDKDIVFNREVNQEFMTNDDSWEFIVNSKNGYTKGITLNSNIPITIYAGEKDIICSKIGLQNLLHTFNYNNINLKIIKNVGHLLNLEKLYLLDL